MHKVGFGVVGFILFILLLGLFLWRFLLLGRRPRLVVIFPNMWDYVVERVEPGQLKRAHELEDRLLLVLGFNHKVHVRWARWQRCYSCAVLAPLPSCDCWRSRLAVMHLGRNILSLPRRQNARVEVHDIFRPFPDLLRVKDDIVVMEVKNEGDIELFTEW